MQEENLGSRHTEGIVDVSVIVPSCFENPLKEESISFLQDVLHEVRGALIPTSAIVGAYHIVTSYLGVSCVSAKSVLEELSKTDSPMLYPEITIDLASSALEYAIAHNIES